MHCKVLYAYGPLMILFQGFSWRLGTVKVRYMPCVMSERVMFSSLCPWEALAPRGRRPVRLSVCVMESDSLLVWAFWTLSPPADSCYCRCCDLYHCCVTCCPVRWFPVPAFDAPCAQPDFTVCGANRLPRVRPDKLKTLTLCRDHKF